MFLVVAGNISREDLEKKIGMLFQKFPLKNIHPQILKALFYARDL